MVMPLPFRTPVRSSGARPVRRRFAFWHLGMVIAALGFVLRALVPAGFMPDARALQVGQIELTLCSPLSAAGSARAVTITWSPAATGSDERFAETHLFAAATAAGLPDHPDESLAGPAGCPFSLMAAQGVIAPPDVSVVPTVTPFAPGARQHPPASLALPAQGPPLGSRAPPAAA
jgi:hypothetical protein